MPTKAFVLIETAVGKTRDVASALRQVPEVRSVDVVTGPYDVIAVVEAESINAIGELLTSRIHTLSGVNKTVTCVAIGS